MYLDYNKISKQVPFILKKYDISTRFNQNIFTRWGVKKQFLFKMKTKILDTFSLSVCQTFLTRLLFIFMFFC